MRGTVLVVDDLERPRRALAMELEDAGFQVVQAGNGLDAWERFLEKQPDAVITDLVMPRADGLDLLSRIRSRSDVPVILFTARGTVQSAAAAFKAGADDFVASPDVEIDDLVALVDRVVRGDSRSEGSSDLEARIVGSSRPMVRLRDRIAGLASLRTPVLVEGEPGTGRDTVARAIHELGSTSGGDLLRVAAAEADSADVTTAAAVYLDGIEGFSPEAQAFWTGRLGRAETDGFSSGPRILASTSSLLASSAGEVDTYQELHRGLVRYALDLPPLRTIRADVRSIANALVDRIGTSVGRKVRLSPAAGELLAKQRWPGNARQLESLLQRAIAFSRGRYIRRQLVKELLAEGEDDLASIREQRAALERQAVFRALQETGGNVSRAAEILGRSRAAIYRLISKHGIALSRER